MDKMYFNKDCKDCKHCRKVRIAFIRYRGKYRKCIKKQTEKINEFQCEKIIDEIKFYIITSLCKREELMIEITRDLFSLFVSYINKTIIFHRVSEKQTTATMFGVEIKILNTDGYAWTLSKKTTTKVY